MKKANINIGLDIDGVIADFVSAFTPYICRRYNCKITKYDICHFDMFMSFGLRVEKKKQFAIYEKIINKGAIKPISGAQKFINKLKADLNAQIFLISNRSRFTEKATKKWLAKNEIIYDNIYLEKTAKKKENLWKVLKLDVYVDDRLETLYNVKNDLKLTKILLDQPWNKSRNIHGLFVRLKSWKAIFDYIKKRYHITG